jgi:hypothetical protein
MLEHVALALLLAWQLEPFHTIQDRGGLSCKLSCQREAVPPGFTCAIVFNP